jgi:hypothetical protein
MRISDRSLHRFLAVLAFGLYFIYLIRAANRKSPIKLQEVHAVDLEKKQNDPIQNDPIRDSRKKDMPKVAAENQNQEIKISTELNPTIKDSPGLLPAEVFPSIVCFLGGRSCSMAGRGLVNFGTLSRIRSF